MQPSLRYGLLGAVAVIAFFAVLYFSKAENFFHPGLQWASLVIYLVFMYKATLEDCAEFGVERDFRAIVRTPFLVFVLINLGYWMFYYGLHLAYPSLLVTEMQMEMKVLQEQLNAGLGDPQQANQYRERMLEIENAIKNPMPQPLGPVITRMFIGALGGFALAAGVAFAVRSTAKK